MPSLRPDFLARLAFGAAEISTIHRLGESRGRQDLFVKLRPPARPSEPDPCYLSDASYWMYLTHLPLAIAIPGVLAPMPLPALVKFTITVAVTTTVTLLLYHCLVRTTAIGELLNGRRYPRGLTAR